MARRPPSSTTRRVRVTSAAGSPSDGAPSVRFFERCGRCRRSAWTWNAPADAPPPSANVPRVGRGVSLHGHARGHCGSRRRQALAHASRCSTTSRLVAEAQQRRARECLDRVRPTRRSRPTSRRRAVTRDDGLAETALGVALVVECPRDVLAWAAAARGTGGSRRRVLGRVQRRCDRVDVGEPATPLSRRRAQRLRPRLRPRAPRPRASRAYRDVLEQPAARRRAAVSRARSRLHRRSGEERWLPGDGESRVDAASSSTPQRRLRHGSRRPRTSVARPSPHQARSGARPADLDRVADERPVAVPRSADASDRRPVVSIASRRPLGRSRLLPAAPPRRRPADARVGRWHVARERVDR